jgi:hypothetical protein
MGVDLRYPIGWMFSLLGALLVGYSLLHPDLRAPLAPLHVDLYAGLAMLAFGVSMLLLAARAGRRAPRREASPRR